MSTLGKKILKTLRPSGHSSGRCMESGLLYAPATGPVPSLGVAASAAAEKAGKNERKSLTRSTLKYCSHKNGVTAFGSTRAIHVI